MYNNFKVLIDLGIDGFDYDCEEFSGQINYDKSLINVIVDMAQNFY